MIDNLQIQKRVKILFKSEDKNHLGSSKLKGRYAQKRKTGSKVRPGLSGFYFYEKYIFSLIFFLKWVVNFKDSSSKIIQNNLF